MLTLVEALNYRSLKYVSQGLQNFHVLVGPNASGKTTFLDVPAFLGRLVSHGLDAALDERTTNFQDLTWLRAQNRFELAVEARIPTDLAKARDTVRYEVAIGTTSTGEVSILAEKLSIRSGSLPNENRNLLRPDTLLTPKSGRQKTVVNKISSGNDSFYPETNKGPSPSFKLGPRRSALGSLPEDESLFPIATWFKRLLVSGLQQIILNSLLIRKASAPGQARGFKPDGSNLPWVIADLETKAPNSLHRWVEHVRTALPDLEGVRTVERSDDKHRYLVLRYAGGLEVPSWMASDGTLRLLALTLPAYLPDFRGIYLIEEPENGIHPRAVETVFQSLSSAYEAQILLATHSSVILSIVDAATVLCFSKGENGATQIVPGNLHPALANWRGEANLGVLFAAGVLG